MKTEKQIKARIKEIENDSRYKTAPATIHAPLLLIQRSFQAEVAALKWVLEK